MNLAVQKARIGRPRFEPPPFWINVADTDFAAVWFPSGGCAWDFRGYCSACNFGHPNRPGHDRMVQGVALGLAALPRIPRTLWVSSFNMFHDKEVAPAVRRRIFALVADTPCETVFSETHPRTVTQEAMAECVSWLPGKTFVVELGAESMNDFVRKWCIHKDFDNAVIDGAIATAHAAGAQCALNLMVGAAFLSERESIDYAVSSVRRALAAAADAVILFPCRVKEHTLVGWLHDRHLYQPPSLLCLIEVLLELEPEERKRISLSWVTSKAHPGRPTDLQPVVHHHDPESVYHALRAFERDGEAARLEALRGDEQYRAWLKRIDRPAAPLPDRLIDRFAAIGEGLLPAGWWAKHGGDVEAQVRADWGDQLATRAGGQLGTRTVAI